MRMLIQDILKERTKSRRMWVIWPILALVIIGSAWGLADPRAQVTEGLSIDNGYDVMYVSSVFILLSATLGCVLNSFDGIARDRISGVLEIHLSQPISRSSLARASLFGHWAAICIPTLLLVLLSVLIIRYRMGEWVGFGDVVTHLVATSLVLYWYTVIQLIASSFSRDMGSAVAIGIGAWMTFTLLWLLVTALAGGLIGVETTDGSWISFEALMDLFSPNGVYHHLLETRLDTSRGIHDALIWVSAIVWTILPTWILMNRYNSITP